PALLRPVLAQALAYAAAVVRWRRPAVAADLRKMAPYQTAMVAGPGAHRLHFQSRRRHATAVAAAAWGQLTGARGDAPTASEPERVRAPVGARRTWIAHARPGRGHGRERAVLRSCARLDTSCRVRPQPASVRSALLPYRRRGPDRGSGGRRERRGHEGSRASTRASHARGACRGDGGCRGRD